MINVQKDGVTQRVTRVNLNDDRVNSVFVEKENTGRKYFVHYDGTVSISRSDGSAWVGYSMPYYAGHTLGFFIAKYHVTTLGVRTNHWKQISFHNGPGSSFSYDFERGLDGAVGCILFMHPFCDNATVQKYANAFSNAFPSDADEMYMSYNYDFLSNEGYTILPSFFNGYGITADTCNEECFGMITVNSSPSAYDFISKSQVFS